MADKTTRVAVTLTEEEIERLDHYRRKHRLSRASALRIAAFETIPGEPARDKR